MFHKLQSAVCRKTFSRVAAKCVCVQIYTVLIVGRTFEKFCAEVQVVLQLWCIQNNPDKREGMRRLGTHNPNNK